MLKSLEEVKKVELNVSGVINGVDNANLMSVDSTEPFQTGADELESEEAATEEQNKAAEKEATEKKVAEEKPEAKKESSEEESGEELTAEEIEAKAAETPAKDSAAKRIGRLTKKWRTVERDRDFERTKRLEAEAELKKLRLTIPATDKPDPEDFEDTPSYLEALTDWKVEQKLNTQRAEATAETEETSDRQAVEDIEEELEIIADRGRDKYDDYDALVFDKDLVLTHDMIETILQSDISEEILYYLGSNPETSASLGEMSALKAAREIGKLEVEIAAGIPKLNTSSEGGEKSPDAKPVKTPKKKTTKAPEPIIPVKTTGVTDKDPSKMSPKEYRAWRERNKE